MEQTNYPFYHLLFGPDMFSCKSKQSGSVLVGLLITLVLVSSLGAAMLSQTSTGFFDLGFENSSARAYYLAESGYRYAAAKLQHGADMDSLHSHGAYSLGAQGSFTLVFKTHIFDITGGDGTPQLVTEVPFGDAPSLPSEAGTGNSFYMKIDNNTESFDSISIDASPDDHIVRFTKNTGNWNAPSGKRIQLLVKSNGDALSEGGDLNLQSTSPADTFPLYNGRIVVDNKTYQYKKRETNKLVGVTRVDDSSWVSPSLYDGAEILLQNFMELHSTGTFGGGTTMTSREIVYSIPLAGSQQVEYHDSFDDRSHWSDTSLLGTHGIESIGGDNVLKVTGTDTGPAPKSSLISFEWESTNIKFNRAHSSAGNFLSYDAQVKVGFDTTTTPEWGFDPAPIPKYFAAGISFRLDNNQNSYGVSFLRGNRSAPSPYDNIDDYIVPMDDTPLIVLWQQTNFGNDRTWLAYKMLIPVFFSDDMESGTSGWTPQSPWAQVHTSYHSTNTSWHDSPGGNYSNNANTSLVSPSLDLSGMTDVYLVFWHMYSLELWEDYGYVEISTDGGSSWESTALDDFTGSGGWSEERIHIPDSYLTDNVKIRFRLDTDWLIRYDGWYIDDVKIESDFYPFHESTLLVRVKEATSIQFTGGNSAPIKDGDLVEQDNGAFGTVLGDPILTSGSWGTDAAGTILLNSVSSTAFQAGALKVGGVTLASAVPNFRSRDNYIRVYYGDTDGYGTPNSTPFDYEKHGNPRITSGSGTVNWPPDEVVDTSPDNDYFTIVQWDAVNSSESGSIEMLTSQDEPDVILRGKHTDLLTPTSGVFNQPELGLHAYGHGATNVYYDDFALQADIPAATAFLPAIQK